MSIGEPLETTKSSGLNEVLEVLGEGGYSQGLFGAVFDSYESIGQVRIGEHPSSERHYESQLLKQVDYLISTIDKDKLSTIEQDLEFLQDGLDEYGYFKRWTSDRWQAADRVANIVAGSFPFTNEKGYELAKGSFAQNLEGFWTRRKDPRNDRVIIDCKLPSIVLWRLLDKYNIQSDILVKYSSSRPYIPNFSAHPQLRLRISHDAEHIEGRNGQMYSGDVISKGMGINLQFLAKEQPYVVSPDFGSDYVHFRIGGGKRIGGLVRALDRAFVIGNLVFNINYSNERLDDYRSVLARKKILQNQGWDQLVVKLFPELGKGGGIFDPVDNMKSYYRHLLSATTKISDY